jgi:hypothetical protein
MQPTPAHPLLHAANTPASSTALREITGGLEQLKVKLRSPMSRPSADDLAFMQRAFNTVLDLPVDWTARPVSDALLTSSLYLALNHRWEALELRADELFSKLPAELSPTDPLVVFDLQGHIAERQGDYAQAGARFVQGLAISKEIKDPIQEAYFWIGLGRAFEADDKILQSAAAFNLAQRLCKESQESEARALLIHAYCYESL